MLIIDAQVHLWAADRPDRPWPRNIGAVPHRPTPFLEADLLAAMAAAGVDRAVIVPPSWEGDRNDLALAAARHHPERFAVMGRLSLTAPESRAALAGWRQQPGMLGLRFTFHTPPSRAWLSDGTADWLWREAERLELPVMVFTPGSLPAVARIAERHPGLRLVIDHLALANDARDAAAFADLPALLALARHANVAVKATSLPSYSSQPYPHQGLHEPIRRVVDAFGPRRVFWGSDVTRLPGGYRQCVTLFTEALPWLGERDKEWIMGRGVATWLGWPLPGETTPSP